MATKSAGRVSIRVLPDSTRFREDLKKSLERIERTMKAEIPAELVVTRESVRKLKEQLRDLEVRIKVDPYVTKENLHEIKKNIEELDPDVRVGLNTAVARARLTALTRPRTVPIFVRINQASFNAAMASLAALSGARFLGNVFDKFWDSIKNLDKSAPRIALVVSGINLLAGGLLAATSNAAGLAASLAALGQAAVLLPALMTGAGISIGVLIAALKDTKTVLADLGPSFNNLQDIISNQFWAQAAQPIREMVNSLMPTLNVQLGNLAAAWGRVFASLSQSIQTSVTPDKLTFMMENLTRAVDIAARAMQPLVNAFTTLGMFGSQYLPRLSEWFVKLSEDFNRFITEAAADGSLDRWAERGIKEFKALGRVLKETVRVFAALSRAAEQAGGAGFEQLANGLQKLADTMNTSNFQTTLATLFYGAHRLMDGLIDGLDRLGPGLANFAPTLASVFNTTGKIVGQFLEDIGILLSSPELQKGMDRFFGSFLTFLTDLKPAMGPLGELVGLIGDIAGTFLSEFGLLISEIAPSIVKVFKAVWEAIKPLVPTLVDLVEELLPPFTDILLVLAQEVLPPVVDLIKKLAPGFAELAKEITPYIVEFMKDFAGALREFNDEIKVEDVVNFAREIGNLIRTIEDFLNTASSPKKTFEWMNSDSVKETNKKVNDELANFWATVNSNIEKFNSEVNGKLDNFWTSVHNGIQGVTTKTPEWNAFWDTLAVVTERLGPFGPAVQVAMDTAKTAIELFVGTKSTWELYWQTFHNPPNAAMILVVNEINNGMGRSLIQMTVGFASIFAQWTAQWPTLIPTIVTFFANAAGTIGGGFPGLIAQIIIGMAGMLREWGQGWLNIVAAIPGWFERIGAGITSGIAVAVGIFAGMPSQMIARLAGWGASFFSAGFSLIADFAEGIRTGVATAVTAIEAVIAAVTGRLPGSPAKYGPLSGKGWTRIRGQHLAEDFALGMKERTELVKTTANDMASATSLSVNGAAFTSAASVVGVPATTTGAALVNIEGDYYGATPEKVASEFDRKIRRANLVSQIRGVSK